MVKTEYSVQDIQVIRTLLIEKGVLHFPRFKNGLFPAAIGADTKNTGYRYVWVRDNVYTAYAHYIVGEPEVASKNVLSLMSYFKKFKFRFDRVIDNSVDPSIAAERPNIRFDGDNLTEINEAWEHAQNDALGYFLWLYCKLCAEAATKATVNLQQDDVEMLSRFPLYFQTIRYWEDEDSGHWEEGRKMEASSIGVVVAGLKALQSLYIEGSSRLYRYQYKGKPVKLELLEELIQRGISALRKILPAECIQPPQKKRRYDGALLFLLYPIDIVPRDMEKQIIDDVNSHLKGDYGIRRYLGDSFWCRDFHKLPKRIQTSIYTERQQWLKENGKEVKLGEEAQWCIFDPILSAVYGRRFQSGERKQSDLEQQIKYLNRSLGQITGKGCRVNMTEIDGVESVVEIEEFRCPELYFIQEGKYVPNVSTPLLWTQANLSIALEMMRRSLIAEQ